MASREPHPFYGALAHDPQTEQCIISSGTCPRGDADIAERCKSLLDGTMTVQQLTIFSADLTETQKKMVSACLSQSPSVPKIDLLGRSLDTSNLGHLLFGISENRSMQEFYISNMTIDSAILDSLEVLLKTPSCSLSRLILWECVEACSDADAQRFAEACRVNRSVKEFTVKGTGRVPRLGPVLRYISENKNLQLLDVKNVTIDGGTLHSLAILLKSPSCSLVRLTIQDCMEDYSLADAVEFAEACCLNRSVQELSIEGPNFMSLFTALVGNPATSVTQHPATTTLELSECYRGPFIRHDLLKSKLQIGMWPLSRADCERLVDGIRRSNALREFRIENLSMNHDSVLVLSGMIQGLSSLQTVKLHSVPLLFESRVSLLQAVYQNTSIKTFVMDTGMQAPRASMQFSNVMGAFIASSPHVMHLDVGCHCHPDGFPQLAQGLRANQTLRSLTLRDPMTNRVDSWKVLIEEGLRSNTSLESLILDLPIADQVSRPLASYIQNSTSLRILKLHFTFLEGNDWPMMINALGLHPALEEVRITALLVNLRPCVREQLAHELASVIPKLRKVRTLDIRGETTYFDVNMGCQVEILMNASRFSLLNLNMSLTAIDCAIHPGTDAEMKAEHVKFRQIENRNRALSNSDYGVQSPPSVWPFMISVALRNKHVGPSLVHRLLTARPGEINTGKEDDISKEPPLKKARLV